MPSAPTYRSRWPEYAKLWDAAEVRPGRTREVAAVCKRLFAAKDRYVAVEKATGVPWWWVAAVHERESGQDWRTSIAQGDRWDRVSTHVPSGRGPFKSFEEAAYDALVTLKHLDRVFHATPDAVRLEKALYQWERYNGWGYYWYHKSTPSPYLWGATTAQRPGKYVADSVWSPTVMDQQLGCASILLGLMDLDPTIKPAREN